MNLTKQGIQKSLGPGIVLAGACIGGSHLVFSTEAGAKFGFALVGLILITNLMKYPFLLVGTRFTAATGKSLLEGFQAKNKFYLPVYLIVSLITGTFTIAAVSFISSLLLQNFPLFASFKAIDLSIGILVIGGLILLLGHYKALDRLSKFLVILLTLLTFFAVISLLSSETFLGFVSTDMNRVNIDSSSPWQLANLSFLIPLMGWMPGPVELCVWPSLWMFSRSKDSRYKPSIKEAEFDFNLGYVITVITAMFFVTLGALTIYRTGGSMLDSTGFIFAKRLIGLYQQSIGNWAIWIIVPAAFAAMFSTTLTCLDAYPRSISAIQGLLLGTDKGQVSTANEGRRLERWMVLHVFSAQIALILISSTGISMKDFLFAATTGSFLTAPLFAWMAMDTMNSSLVPSKYQYGFFMKCLCWFGLLFLGGFSLLFIANQFFGFGIVN